MKKRFTEEQIIGFLREAESGLSVADLCRRQGRLMIDHDLSVSVAKTFALKRLDSDFFAQE